MKSLNLMALSGSLRSASYNTAAIQALKVLAPESINIEIGCIANLPLFNPDREVEHIPALETMKDTLRDSDGLIIASPEYAHGITGVMKNALDWLVAGSEFPDKPVMLVNTSPRASHAQEALKEVLITMSANVIHDACISIPLLGSELDAEGIIKHKAISAMLISGLRTFCLQIEKLENTN